MAVWLFAERLLYDDPDPFGSQCPRHRQADSFAGTRDHCHLAVQCEIHGSPFRDRQDGDSILRTVGAAVNGT